MPSTYSPNLRIELIASGEQANTWGNTTNTNLGTLIEQAIAGLSNIDVTAGDVTLTAYNGASDQSRQMILNVTGTPGVARTLTAPSVSKVYVVANNSDADVTIETATGTGVTVSSGYSKFVFCDGTDFSDVTTETTVLAVEDLIVNGDATLGDALTDVITINGTVQPGVVISGSSSSAALRITQTGAGNALLVEDSANPDATPFSVDASGNVSVGGNLNVPGLTASRALATDASKNLVSSTVTSTELGYLSGVTSAIQTQLNSKAGTATANTFTNNQIISVNSSSDALRITQTGTGNALVVEDSANPDSTPFVIDNAGSVGIGSTSLAGFGVRLSKQISGSIFSYGYFIDSSNAADVTNTYIGFGTNLPTANAVANLRHYSASQGTFTGAVSNQYGYYVAPTLTGATNNYGFYADIASGSGRYNFFAASTADNFFGGPVVVSTSSTSDALRITQTGTGNALVVEDSTNPDSTPFVIDSAGNVFKGYTSSISVEFPWGFQINGTGADAGFSQTRWANNTGSPAFYLAKSRGAAVATRGIVQSGDPLGFIQFAGDDGANFVVGASVSSAVDGTPGLNDMPSRLVFNTTADGASSPTERMRIDSAGAVGIGTTPTAGVSLQLGKTITGAANAYQIFGGGVTQSDVTGVSGLYVTVGSTAAASFTLGNLNHFWATQGTIGAGSSVTNQYGFHASSNLTGATTNYGFLSNIPSGSGRYNFYAGGTAANYFAGSVGFGTLAPAGTMARLGYTVTGNPNSFAIDNQWSVASDVTSTCTGYRSVAYTQAASFTVGAVKHYDTVQVSFGAGSTVTNQYGYAADVSLTGATNNYGFFSGIPSGAGRYNFFAGGTADNYFAGSVGVGNPAAAFARLQVSGTLPSSSAFSYGISSAGAVPSSSTSGYVGFDSAPSTQASAFTLSALAHFQAYQGTIGVGSAVTNQYGFSVTSSLTGATANFGFYSAIASGSGRYNFYAAGTADNYFAGLILSNSSIKSNSATAGIGYGTGAGGTVTQTISRTTGVTLNKICGSVTVFSASATIAADFTVTNSTVSATDTIICSIQASGATGIYLSGAYAVANGSFKIYMSSPSSVTEAPTINFTVIKSVTA